MVISPGSLWSGDFQQNGEGGQLSAAIASEGSLYLTSLSTGAVVTPVFVDSQGIILAVTSKAPKFRSLSTALLGEKILSTHCQLQPGPGQLCDEIYDYPAMSEMS